MALQDALQLLDQLGFTDVFLPFILIFTIVFAVLEKIHLFGEGKSKKYNSVIALSLAIGVVIPHVLGKYPAGSDIVEILNNALPNVSIVIVALVFLLVFIGLFGGEAKWGSGVIGGFVTFAALGLILYIFGSAAGWWENSQTLYYLYDSNVQATLLIIAVFWVIISTITKDENSKNYGEETGRFFGWIPPGAPPAGPPKGPGGH